MKFRKRLFLENLIYAVIWFLIFLLPIIGNYFSLYSGKESSLNWRMISSIWLGILPLFGVFVINNWFLARYLLRKKYVTYTVLVVAVIVAMLGLNFVGRRFIEHPKTDFILVPSEVGNAWGAKRLRKCPCPIR